MPSLRSLALVSAFLCLPVLAAFSTDGRARSIARELRAGERFDAWIVAATGGPAAPLAEYRLMPDGGEGVTVAMELCDAVPASAKAGNWYCIYSDGGVAPGSSQTWAALASGTSTGLALRTCPSGQNCGPLLHTEFIDGGGMYSTAYNATATPFTACGVWNAALNFNPEKIRLMGNASGYFTTSGFAWYADPNNGSYAFGTWDSALDFSIARNIPLIRGADIAMCGIHFANGTVAKTFKGEVLGEAGGTAIANIGTTGQPLPHMWTGSNFDSAAASTAIRSKGIFYTEKVLDAGTGAELISMLGATNAITLYSATGETTLGRRSSSLGCSADTTFGAPVGSVVIGHTMCRSQGKLYTGRAGVNLMPRSNAMEDTLVWLDVGTPVRHLGSVRDHFDTLQSMVLDDNDNGTAEGISQAVFTTGGTGKYHLSCWMMSQDGGTGRLRMVGTSNSVGDSDCSWPLTNVSTRYACSSDAGYTVDPVTITASVLVGANAAAVGSASAIDCQLENGYKPGAYTSTYGNAQTRNSDHTFGSHAFDSGIKSVSGWILAPSAFNGNHHIFNAAAGLSSAHVNAWFASDGGQLHCSFSNAGGVGVEQASTASFIPNTAHRWGCFYGYDGVGTACVDSDCASGAANVTTVDNDIFTMHFGSNSLEGGDTELDSFLWNVCADKSPTICDYR